MRDCLFRKGLVVGIILLFIGVSFLPTISGNKVKNTTTNNILNDYIRYDDFEDYAIGEPPKSERGWTTINVDENQYIEARVDPLDPSNMVMLIHGNSSVPSGCALKQNNFAPASNYTIHYRIYTPQLSMDQTIYEVYGEYPTELVNIHRRTGWIKWGGTGCHFYEFTPPIDPITTRWIEEEVRVSLYQFRLWHDNSIDTLGGFCNTPVNGVDSWSINPYPYTTQDFYIDDFWIKEYVIENKPPNAPTITGETNGKAGEEYEYTFNSEDPNGDDVKYYIDWDDGSSQSTALRPSGTDVKVKHTWSKQGTYTIKARAKDTDNLWGPWATLEVTMPRNRATYNSLLLRFLDNYPLLEKLMFFLIR